jgi:hypothetical protein
VIHIATAENTLLAKLLWYRQGNEVSERDWRDVLGILRVAGQGMDGSYLSRWARELGVADLLDRALGETRSELPIPPRMAATLQVESQAPPAEEPADELGFQDGAVSPT